MKPIKTAEEFQALLDRALAKHEQQGLTHVSLKVIQDCENADKEQRK